MGYSDVPLAQLTETIAGSNAEVVVITTPIDLAALIPINKPALRACYEFAEDPGEPLSEIVDGFLRNYCSGPGAAEMSSSGG
jgi:predicted GTPase